MLSLLTDSGEHARAYLMHLCSYLHETDKDRSGLASLQLLSCIHISCYPPLSHAGTQKHIYLHSSAASKPYPKGHFFKIVSCIGPHIADDAIESHAWQPALSGLHCICYRAGYYRMN